MYNSQKIGIGILTYNRPMQFSLLLNAIKRIAYIDEIRIVKNKNVDYMQFDPLQTDPDISTAIVEDAGIGICKNALMRQLLAADCQHVFIIEDDVKIKKDDAFKKYIDTAAEFNLHHLNFCHTYDQAVPEHTLIMPFLSLKHGNYAIDIYRRLSGVFEYFTAYSLKKVGLIDERYINALEHCEHTYRMSNAMLTTPFYAFADIYHSWEYIEDTGICTTIAKDSKYTQRLMNAAQLFKQTHGCWMSQLPIPTNQQIVDCLDELQLNKASCKKWFI